MPKFFYDLIQGTDEWFAARCGLLTASEMKLIITPAKLQYASNDKERTHLYELCAQRVTGYVEPHYIGDDMLRGQEDEIIARDLYHRTYAPVTPVGFVTNDKYGFTLGCSPDGLVGEEGGLQIKSRRQKYQFEAIVSDEMSPDFLIQVQTELIVTERKWWDFCTFSAGMPMMVKRIYGDAKVQNAIIDAATMFHDKMDKMLATYKERLAAPGARLTPTERRKEEEITV